jgi:hypothetical protein
LKIKKSTDGAGAGTFTSNVTGLEPATKYYIRSYATNDAGTGYGEEVSFTTLGQEPVAISTPATNIISAEARLNGTVNANDLSTEVTFEYGVTTSYGSTITADPNPVTGNINTNVSAIITGLTSATIYHFRIKAVNSLGTIYGNDLSFDKRKHYK